MEGGLWLAETVEQLTERGIPVCCHLGLTPQSVHHFGGYKVQGRDQVSAVNIVASARQLEAAGAQLIVLECIPMDLAAEITEELTIPTIGIGAGPHCDGQVLVLHDMLGINPYLDRLTFARNFMTDNTASIKDAIKGYVDAVKAKDFPSEAESFSK